VVRAATIGLGVGILAVLAAAQGRASLYHPDDHTGVVPVDEKGQPEPFPFEEFQRRRLILRNIGNPDWPLVKINPQTKEPVLNPKTGHPEPSDRGIVDARIKKALAKKPETRTEMERVALAVDLLRFNRLDDAEGALKGQRSGFLPNVTLAHIAAAQGQWARAADFLEIANDEKTPAALSEKSPQLLAWQRKLDRGALRKLMMARMKEASGAKPPPEVELPDEIWGQLLNFVNDAGQYEPGKLAAAEKAKLPGGDFPEAIATVQQLVLWFPFDVRLYWLLGELYAAHGDVQAAKKILDECAESGRYSNRKVLMQHREVVTKVAKEKGDSAQEGPLLAPTPPPPENPPPAPVPFSLGAVWIYFGVVGAIALFALIRTVMKRTRGGSPGSIG
jgi:hypothetical protein